MVEKIRIIDTPPGQAPESIRKEWVGLVLTVAEQAPGQGRSVRQVGARGGQPENQGGYSVSTSEAMARLEEKSPRAAKWWKRNVPLEFISELVFKREVCEVVPEALDDTPNMPENSIVVKEVPGEETTIVCIPVYPPGPRIIYDAEITAFCGSCDHLDTNLYCKLKNVVNRQDLLVRIGRCNSTEVNGQPGTMTKSGFIS